MSTALCHHQLTHPIMLLPSNAGKMFGKYSAAFLSASLYFSKKNAY